MTSFRTPGTRSLRVIWVLEEAGLEYELNQIHSSREAHKNYLADSGD